MRDDDEMSDSAVSIHSIVTDNEDINSDNEAPEDKIGQVDKIIKNHVIKEILSPGSGLKKPSKHDFVTITYKSYFPSGLTLDETFHTIEKKEYLKKLNCLLPIGVIKSIERMRMGEKAKITVRPKYGFKKMSAEEIPKFFDNNFSLKQDVDLISRIKSSTIIYEVSLHSFITIYDITGKGNLMKYIINQGDGINKPNENDEIIFNMSIFLNEKKVFEINRAKRYLTNENFNEAEMIIFKSMKKKEISRIEFSKEYFTSLNHKNNERNKENFYLNFMKSIYNDNHKKERIIYEVELIKFKNRIKKLNYKNVDYTNEIISNGIGNVCPWKNSLIQLALHIEINDEIFYSDFSINLKEKNLILHTELKKLKQEIKSKKNYLIDLQFIIDDLIKKDNLIFLKDSCDTIYNPLLQNFPKFLTREIIPTMKLLQLNKISFNSSIDYLKISDKEIKNDMTIKKYVIHICLLNFQEQTSIFNYLGKKELSSNPNSEFEIKQKFVIDQIIQYKSQANYFFKNNLLKCSKNINKYLIDEYIKFLNLEKNTAQNLSLNKSNFEEKKICYENDDNTVSITIHGEIKKVFTNLILILYKLKKYKTCEEYINNFYHIYDNSQKEEKVLYIEYKIKSEWRNSYEESKMILEKLINLYPYSANISEYNGELDKIKKLIENMKEKKNILVKKMFKFEKNYLHD